MPKRYDDESFNKIVKDKYGDLFEFLEPYQNSRIKIKTKCKFGHEFLGDPKKFTKTDGYKGCPICNLGETREQYELNPNICKYCKKPIQFIRSVHETRQKQFCNNQCANTYIGINKTVEKEARFCIVCGNKLKDSAIKYCSKECQFTNQYNNFIIRWKQGLEDGLSGQYAISAHLKRYLFEKYNNQCSECGWSKTNQSTGNIPLEVHHIDGDYTNNKEENLTLLCPNCHSLTSTYKNGNAGSGRKDRNIYYDKVK